MLHDPDADPVLAEVFGLGSVSFLIFTGTAPADTAEELQRRLTRECGLDVGVKLDGASQTMIELVRNATAGDVDLRTESAVIDADVTIAPDDFEPGPARDGVIAFFRSALARDVKARHDSIETMRLAWQSAFAAIPPAAATPTSVNPVTGEELDQAVAKAVLDTAVASAGLTPRALNALLKAAGVPLVFARGQGTYEPRKVLATLLPSSRGRTATSLSESEAGRGLADFERRMRLSSQERGFVTLGVNYRYCLDAIAALGARFGAERLDVTDELLTAMRSTADALGVDWSLALRSAAS